MSFNRLFHHGTKLGILFLAVFILLTISSPLKAAEGRMAGSLPGPAALSEKEKKLSVPSQQSFYANIYESGNWPASMSKDEIDRLESLSVPSQKNDTSTFKPEIWQGLSRGFVSALYLRIPENPADREHRRFLIQLLGIGGRSDLMQSSGLPEPGQDLFTLRLKRLNSLAAYSEATDLYRQIRDHPYHPDLALAGITSFFGAGEHEEACLEIWAYKSYFEQDNLWSDLDEICRAIFEQDDNLSTEPVRLSLAEVSSSPLIRLLALNQTGRLKIEKAETENLAKTMPPLSTSRLKILYSIRDQLPPSLSLQLSFDMYRLGLIDLKAFKRNLQNEGQKELDSSNRSLNQIPIEDSTNENTSPAIQFADAYQEFIRQESEEIRIRLLADAVRLSSSLNPHAMHSFLDLINTSQLDSLSFYNRHAILKSAVLADNRPDWIDNYALETAKILPQTPERSWTIFETMLLFTINSQESEMRAQFLDKTKSHLINLRKNHQETDDSRTMIEELRHILTNIVIFLLEKKKKKMHSPFQAYEKQKGLTSGHRYVINSFDVKMQLNYAALRHSESQVFLLAFAVLGDKNMKTFDPALLQYVVNQMVEVGLADQAYFVITRVLIG